MKNSILILGAKSDIGIKIAHKFAEQGNPIQLAARKINELEDEKKKIELMFNIKVTLHEFDALNTMSHIKFVDNLPELPSIAISTIGLLGKQNENEKNLNESLNIIRSNYEGLVTIFSILANKFETRRSGTLVGLSSVAGERGRANNYIYGSAKAGFTTFLSGLRNRLTESNVHVLTVLPGYVATKMTKEISSPNFLTAQPEEVAKAVIKGINKKKNIIYTPSIWIIIMLIIKLIPESIFKRIKI